MTDSKLDDNIADELLAVARGISEAVSSADASVAEASAGAAEASAGAAEASAGAAEASAGAAEVNGVPAPLEVKVLKNFLQAVYVKDIRGGDRVTDMWGNKFMMLKPDKVWNEYENLLVSLRDGRVLAASSLAFPVIVEV